jgi:hypothetical protein
MTPQKLLLIRRCLFTGLTALRAIERCQRIEAEVDALVMPAGDDPAAWSSRVRAERQREQGVKARSAALAAVARYRQRKAEAEHA